MKQRSYPGGVAVFMALIIAMLPVAFADSISLTYDLNGNLVTGDGVYREYNSLNQLWKVYNGSDTSLLLQEYTYHPVEERVLIKQLYNDSGEVYETIYYVNENLVRTVNSSGSYDTVYVKHGGQLVAEVKPDSSVKYYHPDHLGSSTVITDEVGEIVENTFYTPYGAILEGGEQSRYDYEGKEFDDVTGQYDFNFRGYKADWGVFTQPDTILQNIYDPQLLNRYGFERNNPLNKIDPDGHRAGSWWGRPIDSAMNKFNQIWDTITQKTNQVIQSVWKQVPKPVANLIKGGETGSVKDVADMAHTESKRAIFGEYFVSDEELEAKRYAGLRAIASELVDKVLGVITSGGYTVSNRLYQLFTGDSSIGLGAIENQMSQGWGAFNYFPQWVYDAEQQKYIIDGGSSSGGGSSEDTGQDGCGASCETWWPETCTGTGCPE